MGWMVGHVSIVDNLGIFCICLSKLNTRVSKSNML